MQKLKPSVYLSCSPEFIILNFIIISIKVISYYYLSVSACLSVLCFSKQSFICATSHLAGVFLRIHKKVFGRGVLIFQLKDCPRLHYECEEMGLHTHTRRRRETAVTWTWQEKSYTDTCRHPAGSAGTFPGGLRVTVPCHEQLTTVNCICINLKYMFLCLVLICCIFIMHCSTD